MIAEHLPEKSAGLVVQRDQRLQALGQRFNLSDVFERVEARFGGGIILQRLPVDGVNLPVFSHPLVTSLAALLAKPAALNHCLRNGCMTNRSRNGIVRHGFAQIFGHVRPDVETHDIHQPVAGALWQPDQRPCQRIHFLDRQVELNRQLLNGRAEKRPDPVRDEVGRVLARHHTFAQMQVAESRQ